jgi:glycosidase
MTPEAEELAASVQSADRGSTLSFYRRLIRYRQSSEALLHGAYRAVEGGEDVFTYVRAGNGERLLVALNFAPEARRLGLAEVEGTDAGRVELSTHAQRTPGPVALRALVLRPDEGVVLRLP